MDNIKKPYDLTMEPRDEYLYAIICGDFPDTKARVACWAEIIERCRADGRKRLMFVLDQQGTRNAIAAFESASAVAELGQGIKIAFVDLNIANYETNQFAETVAANRGAFSKVFTTEAEAHNWLVGPR